MHSYMSVADWLTGILKSEASGDEVEKWRRRFFVFLCVSAIVIRPKDSVQQCSRILLRMFDTLSTWHSNSSFQFSIMFMTMEIFLIQQ